MKYNVIYDYNCCFEAEFKDKLEQCYNKIIDLCNIAFNHGELPDTIYVGNRKFYGMLDKRHLKVFIKDALPHNEVQIAVRDEIVGSLTIKNLPKF